MTLETREFNFDGIVGPTHNYAGLSFGNIASKKHQNLASSPRAAALQGLEKMRFVARQDCDPVLVGSPGLPEIKPDIPGNDLPAPISFSGRPGRNGLGPDTTPSAGAEPDLGYNYRRIEVPRGGGGPDDGPAGVLGDEPLKPKGAAPPYRYGIL